MWRGALPPNLEKSSFMWWTEHLTDCLNNLTELCKFFNIPAIIFVRIKKFSLIRNN